MSLGRRVVLALVVVGFAACGDSPTEPTEPEDVSGTYNLQTVNERSLPFLPDFVLTDFAFYLITAWSITLNQDMTCSERVERRGTALTGFPTMKTTETDVCTYTFNGGAITLTFPADVLTGSMSGFSLTITDDGDVFVFEK